MKNEKNLKIAVFALISFGQVFGVNKFIGRKFRYRGSCIHSGFEGIFKPAYSPDERFSAIINSKDGLRIVNNDNQETILAIDTVEINDFGFSSDNRYFFIDYCSGKQLSSSIDIFDLGTRKIIVTISQYKLFSCSRRRKSDSCNFNDLVRFICRNNVFTVLQNSQVSRKIVEVFGVSSVKYCSGSERFACQLKSGVLKIFQMSDFEVQELFAFLPYSYQNPGRSFFRP